MRRPLNMSRFLNPEVPAHRVPGVQVQAWSAECSPYIICYHSASSTKHQGEDSVEP